MNGEEILWHVGNTNFCSKEFKSNPYLTLTEVEKNDDPTKVRSVALLQPLSFLIW